MRSRTHSVRRAVYKKPSPPSLFVIMLELMLASISTPTKNNTTTDIGSRQQRDQKAMMYSAPSRHNAAEPSYAEVWEDTSSESCGSPLPRVMSFDRRPTEEFSHPKRAVSAISRLVAAQRRRVPPTATPSLLTALLKPCPIVEPLVSPTTTKNPIISPTNRPGMPGMSRGLESLRNIQDPKISAASSAPIPPKIEVLGASPVESIEPSEEDVLSPSTPPASLTVEYFDPNEYEYNQKYRPSIPDHDHQWHPSHESQPKYYAFPAYCPQEQLQESSISASPLFDSLSPHEECFHTRSDSAISGISLGADDGGVNTEAIPIPGSLQLTFPPPPPLLRTPPSPTSLLMSWAADIDAQDKMDAVAGPESDVFYPGPDEDQTTPSSLAASPSTGPADPETLTSASYCTHCVIPFAFDLSTSYFNLDENWECCNCAAKNMK